MAILLVLMGLVLLGAALGFVAAVSLGMRREDETGEYRSLRNGARLNPLAKAGRRMVGLSIRPDPIREESEPETDDDPPNRTLAAA